MQAIVVWPGSCEFHEWIFTVLGQMAETTHELWTASPLMFSHHCTGGGWISPQLDVSKASLVHYEKFSVDGVLPSQNHTVKFKNVIISSTPQNCGFTSCWEKHVLYCFKRVWLVSKLFPHCFHFNIPYDCYMLFKHSGNSLWTKSNGIVFVFIYNVFAVNLTINLIQSLFLLYVSQMHEKLNQVMSSFITGLFW